MYKHLFLEADSGAGKSTLIRKLLEPYKNHIGGFSSQRLLNEDNKTIGFRIVDASDFRLAIPYENTPESIFRMIPENGHSSNNLGIFENEGIRILKNVEKAKLILLDEIGGVELKNEAFRERIYELLSGDVPCIGVIKQQKKAAHISSSNTKIDQLNCQLRDYMLKDCNCGILNFQRNNIRIEGEISVFIENIFK